MPKMASALILIAAGIFVIIMASRREDSVIGVADEVGASVANTWDGKARQPEHVWYYAGGGVLIAAGLFMALRERG
jgi:glutamate 5-kinase